MFVLNVVLTEAERGQPSWPPLRPGQGGPVNPGSDVDWDPPEETEDRSSSSQPRFRKEALPAMRPFKRQLTQKTNIQRFDPDGFNAVRPAICSESRLSREPGAPLYSVHLGTRKTKPQLLYPLALLEMQTAATQIQAVCGRENGQV